MCIHYIVYDYACVLYSKSFQYVLTFPPQITLFKQTSQTAFHNRTMEQTGVIAGCQNSNDIINEL